MTARILPMLIAVALAPVAAHADEAVLQGLDKTTARISRFEAPLDRPVKFGTLTITVKACRKRPPEEPPESAAFMEVDETRPGDRASVRVFSGWMFASSPALSAMDHPVYDIGVIDCKTDTASAGSSRKK
jgi:hypothetical protein